MRRIIAIALVILTMLSLSSCGIGEFFAVLGFDTHDYEGEEVIAEHNNDSDIAKELTEMVKILTINSIDIPEFKGTSEAIECCRDSVLNSMYSQGFAKYAGNPELIGEAEDIYPHLNFSVIIPADDFENTAYKYFGGKEKITNESGAMFDYVEEIDSYITAATPVDSEMVVNIHSIEETENTYRLIFDCTVEEDNSDDYFALIIKRADGSLYFKYVENLENK